MIKSFLLDQKERILAFSIGIDQALNGYINKYPDETLSAAAYRLSFSNPHWSTFRRIVDTLFFFDKETRHGKTINHCELSWESELKKKHMPREYRNR